MAQSSVSFSALNTGFLIVTCLDTEVDWTHNDVKRKARLGAARARGGVRGAYARYREVVQQC